MLAQRAFLPWETRYSVDPSTGQTKEAPGDARDPFELGEALVAAMDALPADGGEAREEFLGHYAALRGEIVLGNDEDFPHRRRFTHVSPAWTALDPRGRPVEGDA